jgi:hypothetical protein
MDTHRGLGVDPAAVLDPGPPDLLPWGYLEVVFDRLTE